MITLKQAAIVVTMTVIATPVFAGHANPWMKDGDTVLETNHDSNQARSADTPGQDEMRGKMQQTAFGKLSGKASSNSGLSENGSRGGQKNGQGGRKR